MRPNTTSRLLQSLLAAGLLLAAAPAGAQSFSDFSTYVAFGDSLTAGFESNSLVATHQARSYPAQIARQGGAGDFQQPLISEPGIPPELALLSLLPSPVIAPKSSSLGLPVNLLLPRPYNNMAVPGATSVDLLTRTTDAGGLHDLILRGGGTALSQGLALHPSVITLWIGNNDVLGAAISGRAIPGVTLTPADVFRATFQAIVSALKSSGAPIVAANLPDVTAIPFVTTISRFVPDPSTGQPVLVNGAPVPLLGPSGPLPEGSYVTLAASSYLARGVGIPAALGGSGQPLPDEVVLDPAEIDIIKAHVDADNQAIQEICGAAGIPVVDIHGIFAGIASQGLEIGGVRVTAAFLTGGLFSYDGVHPTDLGYGIVANEFIKTMNAAGGKLPLVDLGGLMGLASSSRAQGLPEFSKEAWEGLLTVFPPVNLP
jgi:lysophospholipase L1-like esterase